MLLDVSNTDEPSNNPTGSDHVVLRSGELLEAGNTPDLGDMAMQILSELLPGDWSFRTHRRPARVTITPPAGPANRFAVHTAARADPRDVARFQNIATRLHNRERLLVVAPHFGPRSRELLKELNISYLDSTGNAWISGDSVLIHRTGTDRGPKNAVDRLSRTSLRGPVTGRVVRFLCETQTPLKVRRIAAETNVHPGNVSRILDLLSREKIVERDRGGSVSHVDWEALIRRWSTDLRKDRRDESFLEPHGLAAFTSRLAVPAWDLEYSVTGAFAAAELVPVAVPVSIDVYVEDIEEARAAFALRRSERVGNVRLIKAFDGVVFRNTLSSPTGVVLAAPDQVAADLITLPRRSADEYAAFVEWMKLNEPVWRR
jgi:hypothetical protein